jgi:hypothetical protein
VKTTFKEHDIEVTTDFRFRVTGPMFGDKGLEFSSIDDARADINKRGAALAQQRKTEAALALPALDERGERVTIRGIHSGQGVLLGIGNGRSAFPDVEWIRDLLIRRTELATELTAIDHKTNPYRITGRRSYGRVRPEDYEGEINKLKAELSVATERAKKKENENV